MGILNQLLGNSEKDETPRENFVGPQDLSEHVTVMLVDPWPFGRPLIDYTLAFILDENIEDPVILQCTDEIAIPEGARIFPFDDTISSPWEDTTYTLIRGQLLDPEVADLAGAENFWEMPESMQGNRISEYEREDEGILVGLVAGWKAVQEAEEEN